VNIQIPPPVFTRGFPAGRRSSCPEPPAPPPVAAARWARCTVDEQLHLLAPADVTAAGTEGHAHALCVRRVPAEGLTLNGPAGSLCISCLAAGTSP
jgi:hypothetical protein